MMKTVTIERIFRLFLGRNVFTVSYQAGVVVGSILGAGPFSRQGRRSGIIVAFFQKDLHTDLDIGARLFGLSKPLHLVQKSNELRRNARTTLRMTELVFLRNLEISWIPLRAAREDGVEKLPVG